MKNPMLCFILAICLVPASAFAAPRKWIQPPGFEDSQLCIDQNSIARGKDGLTRYDLLALCKLSPPAYLPGEDLVTFWAVRCDQNMSGATIILSERTAFPYKSGPHKGEYPWNEKSQDSRSAGGLFAKYVCHK